MQRVGLYLYLFPTFKQAKKVIWDGRDNDGFPFLSHFPSSIVAAKNETELKLTLHAPDGTEGPGSIFQLGGTDNFDAWMGTNPIGCVFSEYSLQDPKAWDHISPILLGNGGWAIFDYLPRGKNHGHQLYEMAKANPEWFAEILTVNQTRKDDGTRVFTEAMIQSERERGMSEEMIQQEYYCSFQGVQSGSVFGKQIQEAEEQNRICGVPWQPEFPVDTWWDIGTGDATAIWFTQTIGREIHVIDYYENNGSGVGVEFYAKHLQTLPYVWGSHSGPHDLEAHQFAANGKSTREVAAALGLKFNVVDRLDKQSQVNAARAFMQRCYFDRAKTERGRDALVSYHYHWDEKRKAFSDEPYHDWSSNGADAFMYLAVGHKLAKPKAQAPKIELVQYSKGQESLSWMG